LCPYVRGALDNVLAEAVRNFPRIIDHFSARMTCIDRAGAPDANGHHPHMTGRVVLWGGESLLDAVRDSVTYPVIERLQQRCAHHGGVKVVLQTTGDLLTDRIVGELVERGVCMISVASVDDFHLGLEGQAKQCASMDRLSELFQRHGMRQSGLRATTRNWHKMQGPRYSFFGAKPDPWIGKPWPRGRAWRNSLPRSMLADNLRNRWSGGLNFPRLGCNGSEVPVEPDGSVCPCSVKTALPLDSPCQEPLIGILDSLVEQVMGPVLAEAGARRDAARGIMAAAAPRRRTVSFTVKD
jgi:hypothetical protein